MPLFNNNNNQLRSDGTGFLFTLFLVWMFVLLSRPQDVFTQLAPLRPALTASLVVLFFFMFKIIDSFMYPKLSTSKVNSCSQTNLYIALIGMMIIGVPFAYYTRGAFSFLLTDYMKVVLFYFLFIKMVDTVRKLEIVLLVGCLGTGFYATTALMQGILKGQRLTFGRMFDPNDLAFFALSFLPFNFLFISKQTSLYFKLLNIISVISSILVILMSGSRGGFLAFLVVIFMSLAMKTRSIKHWYKVTLMTITLIVFSFNLVLIDFSRYRTLTNLETDYNLSYEWGRVAVWKRGITYMLTNPLTGVGVNCFDAAIGEDRAKQGLKPKWQTAHNSFVLVGAETGVIGFILFTLMNVNAFKTFWRVGRGSGSEITIRIGEMALIGFVGHLICNMFLSQAYSFYWVFYIALSCTLQSFIKNEPKLKAHTHSLNLASPQD